MTEEEIFDFRQLNDEIRGDFIYLREKMSDIKFGISEENAEKLILKCIGKHIKKLNSF